MATTTNMGLSLATVSSTAGPLWATLLNAAIEGIDAHTHTSGSGVRVPSAGLNINAALSFGGYDATALRSARFTSQASLLSAADDIACLYVYTTNGDLYFRDVNGNNVRITASGIVNAAGLSAITFAGSNKGADFTIGASDVFVHYRIDCSAAARTATLPLASGVTDGRFYYLQRTAGSNNIVAACAGSDTINGAASYTFGGGTYAAALVVRTGSTTWVAIPVGQQVNGASVTEAGSLTTGNVLQVSGARALTYGAVNLAGGSNYVTGSLPGGNVDAATTSAYGVISLQQDLAGTGAAPTVVALTGSSNKTILRSTTRSLEWAAATTTPGITQASAAGAGATMTIAAQTSTGAAGGDLVIAGGSGTTTTGGVQAKYGSGDYIFAARDVGSRRGISLFADANVINTHPDGGHNSIYIANVTSMPTTAATGGMRFMANSGCPMFITSAGDYFEMNGVVATTVGAAGGASALPATPTGYFKMTINGVARKVPFYAT